ncbi:MAG TPA: hypothetical protein VMH37_10895 [Candidatus Binataceae bacterium]|nr:hypothetical protein [Candidatus Binataceae bacterium]
MRTNARVLVVGHAGATGYGRIISSILPHLDRSFDIHHFGIDCRGPDLDGEWTRYANNVDGDARGVERLDTLLRQLQPALLLIVHDTYLYDVYRQALCAPPKRPRVVLYSPIEGDRVKPRPLRGTARVDRLVLYHRRAEAAVRSAFSCIQRDEPNFRPPRTAMIPPGIDTAVFRPIGGGPEPGPRQEGRKSARRSLFPNRDDLEDAFIVLNANRNTVRKRLDLSLQAFHIFSRRHSNAWLYLHTGMRDIGYPLVDLAERLGIADRVLTTYDCENHPAICDSDLNLVYNACDVGLNTSMGEGWGLVAFEHAATAAAQVLPAHGVCRDLWDGYAPLVAASEVAQDRANIVEHRIVDARDVAGALEELYTARGSLDRWSALAYRRARDPAWDWRHIGAQWSQLFEEVLSGDARAG